MSKYIDADKLIAEIERLKELHKGLLSGKFRSGYNSAFQQVLSFIASPYHEQPDNVIQWTGSNLQEVIDFTGKSPKFGEWFKSWEEFEQYVHAHGDILKLFCEDGSHYEVPVGAWIVKTPDGYNVPSVARFINAKQDRPKLSAEELDKLVAEEFASRSQITEYGPKVIYNRAELSRFIKRMALVFGVRKEE